MMSTSSESSLRCRCFLCLRRLDPDLLLEDDRPASAFNRSTSVPSSYMLSPRSWLQQGECLNGKNQSYQWLPMIDLKFRKAPRFQGFMPGCVRKMAKVLGGADVGGDNVVSEDASGIRLSGYVIVPCQGSSSSDTCDGLRLPVDMGLG